MTARFTIALSIAAGLSSGILCYPPSHIHAQTQTSQNHTPEDGGGVGGGVFRVGGGVSAPVLLQKVGNEHSQQAEIKHVLVAPLHAPRGGGSLSALNIEHGVPYPSIWHLQGKVEIRMNGFILNADAAEYDEDTGAIQAHGDVKVKPYPPIPERSEAK